MDSEIRIFPTPLRLAETVALDIVSLAKSAESGERILTVALSGGNTPGLLFSVLSGNLSDEINWRLVHLFWGDERCVAMDNNDSNYGAVRRLLLEKIDIPETNIHRIRGELDPFGEALRYSEEIKKFASMKNKTPVFDVFLLGMGEDGHTASIFPGNLESFRSEKICEVANHPVTGQKRITITGRVINNSLNIIFMVTGKNKASVAEEIIRRKDGSENYPAFHVNPLNGRMTWYFDREAGDRII